MSSEKKQYILNDISDNVSNNLKTLMLEHNLNQKQLSKKLGVSESTLSGYMQSKKSPSLPFFVDLKNLFPELSIDCFLFNEVLESNQLVIQQDKTSNTELEKYIGAYYLFYLDSNKKSNSLSERSVYDTIDLKKGILYVSSQLTSSDASIVKCCTVFGIKKKDEVKEIKDTITSMDSDDQIFNYLKDNYNHGIYFGEFNISRMHIFISLKKYTNANNHALIILHHPSIEKEYTGGIGTVNSVSIGHTSDPIIQRIALSKNSPYISDEQIKSQLWLSSPHITIDGERETEEILKMAEIISQPIMSDFTSTLSEKNKSILLKSYVEYLIMKNIENNQMCFGRVSNNDDIDWFQLVKDAEVFHEKSKQGVEDGSKYIEF